MTEEKQQFDLDLSNGSPQVKPREKKQQTRDSLMWFYVGASGQIGFAIVVPLLIGVFGGVWLDSKQGSKPLWTLVGLGIGIVWSIFSLVRTVRDVLRKSQEETNKL